MLTVKNKGRKDFIVTKFNSFTMNIDVIIMHIFNINILMMIIFGKIAHEQQISNIHTIQSVHLLNKFNIQNFNYFWK
jgi:hypothetical protein